MIVASNYRKLTQQELLTEARSRFGDDPMKWQFQCPSCQDIASGADFQQALDDNPRTHGRTGEKVIASDVLGQECIGRVLGVLKKSGPQPERGCDWAAYGLIMGPWIVVLPNGREVGSFPLAPQS
jgi:hypothetical protein